MKAAALHLHKLPPPSFSGGGEPEVTGRKSRLTHRAVQQDGGAQEPVRGRGVPGDSCTGALWLRPRTPFPRASSQVLYPHRARSWENSFLLATRETVVPAGCNLVSPWLVTCRGGDLKGRGHGDVGQFCTVG